MCDIVIARNAVCDEAIHNKVNSLKTLDCFVVKNTPRNDEGGGQIASVVKATPRNIVKLCFTPIDS